jgi:hypothetical protein
LLDAGYDFNLPLPPILRKERSVDILIVVDASTDREYVLQTAEAQAHKNSYRMPSINYATINQPFSVHHDTEATDKAVFMYAPLIKNEHYLDGWDPLQASFTSVANFVYTQEQSAMVANLMKHNIEENKDVLLTALRNFCFQRRPQTSEATTPSPEGVIA